MSAIKEKRFSFAGFQLGVGTDAARAERIRRSALYRYLLKPGLNLVGGTKNGHAAPPHRPMPAVLPPVEISEPTFKTKKAAKLWERVKSINWYHTIDLGDGVVTPGFIDNRPTMHMFGIPDDLTGMRCLDIGTYDGFWAFEFERRGAAEVVAIDVDSPADYDVPRLHREQILAEAQQQEEQLRKNWNRKGANVGIQFPGDGFRMAKEALGSKVTRLPVNVYDLSPETVGGKFDLILISQLLLRLRDPQTIFENMFSVCRGAAIVGEPYEPELEATGRPLSTFIGTRVLGVWWGHSIRSMKKMMEVAGFDPVEEVARFEADNRAGNFSKVILKGYAPASPSANGTGQHPDRVTKGDGNG